MVGFEYLYEAWLEAKHRWSNEQDLTAQSYRAASERLDAASCRLIEALLPQPAVPGPSGAS